jgi:hypothetical protein
VTIAISAAAASAAAAATWDPANYVELAGDTMTGKLTTVASAAGGAGLNLPEGAAPSSPNSGDLWMTDDDGLIFRHNSITRLPIAGNDWQTIASASTCDLDTIEGNFVTVTGTTTITSFGAGCTAGTVKFVKFESALSISYNPTGMLLNGNSIEIQAGDILILHFTAATSGWIALGGIRVGGGPVARNINTPVFHAPEYDSGNSGTSKEINWYNGQNQKSTLTGNVTFTFANPYAGMTAKLRIVQGSGPYTVTWPTIKWVGKTAPVLSTTSGDEDIVVLYSPNGSSYYGSIMNNFGTP